MKKKISDCTMNEIRSIIETGTCFGRSIEMGACKQCNILKTHKVCIKMLAQDYLSTQSKIKAEKLGDVCINLLDK